MTEAATNFEALLREALAPVEPPADLAERLEGTLQSITEMAADELEAWELSAMRDPAQLGAPGRRAGRRRRRRHGARGAARPAPRRGDAAAKRGRATQGRGADARRPRARDAQAARRALSPNPRRARDTPS